MKHDDTSKKSSPRARPAPSPLRIVELDPAPRDEIPYLDAQGRGRIEREWLPITFGRAEGLPDGLDALVFTADLQGRVPGNVLPQILADGRALGRRASDPGELLGVHVADALADALPAPERTAVALCGDLYVVPQLDRRGGLGDVTAVWEAFARRFAEVVGVLGNHDEIPGAVSGWLLDGDVVELGGGLRVGGVGGVVGNPGKPNRKLEADFVDALLGVLYERPGVVLLHQSPELGRSCALLEALEASRDGALVVSGHRHWPEPLVELDDGRQLLNVDGRVVVLVRA